MSESELPLTGLVADFVNLVESQIQAYLHYISDLNTKPNNLS